jgi:hypothetical protein
MQTNFVNGWNTFVFKNELELGSSIAKVVTSQKDQFQSLTETTVEEFRIPMVLYFENPFRQHMINFNFKFPVDVIIVDEKGIVSYAFTEPFRDTNASYIRGFCSVQMVILCPENFITKNEIVSKVTVIQLATNYQKDNHQHGISNERNSLKLYEL